MRKLNREKMQIKVGAFVVFGVGVLMMVVLLLGSQNNYFEADYELMGRFDDISGLREGAAVQLAGVAAGTVGRITFEQSLDVKKVRIFMTIKESFKKRIRKDSVASIVTQGLLGDKMIHISVGSSNLPELKDGDEVITRTAMDISTVTAKVDSLAAKANETVETLNHILAEVKEGEGLIHQIIYDPQGKEIMDSMTTMTKSFERASTQLEGVVAKINSGQGTIGAFINDPTVFNDIKTLLGKANRNKLIRAVIRETLKTKDEELLSEPEKDEVRRDRSNHRGL